MGGGGFVFSRQQLKLSDSKVACDAGGLGEDGFYVFVDCHDLFCNGLRVCWCCWRDFDNGYVAYYIKRIVNFAQFFRWK